MVKVTLRKKPISKGRHSLYLDFYPPIKFPNSTKTTRREFLGMYILDKPKTEWDKQLNKEILQKADIIRVERMKSIINEQFGFLDKKKLDASFLTFFEKNSTLDNISAYKHFCVYLENDPCTFRDLNISLCNGFREYLLNANQLGRKNTKVSQNTASSYFNTFKTILKLAHKEKIINDKIDEELESIPSEDTHIEYLNLQEFIQLSKTPCEEPILKQASLFACTTGLRVSDILKLDWNEIIENSNGDYSLKIITKKGKKTVILPLSDISVKILGERREGKIFKGLTRAMTNEPLKKWIRQAKINKHITFHCLRHSFASILVEMGVDIFIVKELMTHTSIKNTLIYAKAENPTMRKAVNKINL